MTNPLALVGKWLAVVVLRGKCSVRGSIPAMGFYLLPPVGCPLAVLITVHLGPSRRRRV